MALMMKWWHLRTNENQWCDRWESPYMEKRVEVQTSEKAMLSSVQEAKKLTLWNMPNKAVKMWPVYKLTGPRFWRRCQYCGTEYDSKRCSSFGNKFGMWRWGSLWESVAGTQLKEHHKRMPKVQQDNDSSDGEFDVIILPSKPVIVCLQYRCAAI